MTFRQEIIDELLKDYQNPEDLMGEGGILKQLTKALVERCLTAEIDTHFQENQTPPLDLFHNWLRNMVLKKRMPSILNHIG